MDRRIKPRVRKDILIVAMVRVFCLVGVAHAFADESDICEAEAAYWELFDGFDDATEGGVEVIGVI